MPTVLTPTFDVGAVRPWQRRSTRAIARIVQPIRRGMTVYRVDGVWTASTAPSAAKLAEADEVLLGGHRYELSDELYDEITNAGISLTILA